MTKYLFITIGLVSLLSCSKEYTHPTIEFGYVDSILGEYEGIKITSSGPYGSNLTPPYTIDTTYINFEIEDMRTTHECKIYVEELDEIFYLESNTSFYKKNGTITQGAVSIGNFHLDSFNYSRRYYSKFYNYISNKTLAKKI